MKYGVSIILVVIFVIASIVRYKKKKQSESIQNQLVSLLQQGKYSEFDIQVKEAYDSGYLDSFHYNYMRMNRYIMCDDNKNVDIIVKDFVKKDLKDIQRASVFSNAMIYYVSALDKQMCELCYEQILKLKGNEDLKKTAGLVYRIIVEKRKDDLKLVEDKIASSVGAEKQFYEQLKSTME